MNKMEYFLLFLSIFITLLIFVNIKILTFTLNLDIEFYELDHLESIS